MYMHVYGYKCMYMHVYACICTYKCAVLFQTLKYKMYVYVRIWTYIYVYACICMYMFVYVCIFMYKRLKCLFHSVSRLYP